MRLVRQASVPLVLFGVGLACSSPRGGAVNLSVAPSIVFPEGVLDSATALDLTVYDTKDGVGCDSTTSTATNVTGSITPVATKTLGTTGCTGTEKFCGSLTITKGADSLVFFAQALDANQSLLANGCTTATVNQDTLAVSIAMQRYVSPATCGNGVIETGEQCDPPTPDGGTDIVCDQDCHTEEEVLSMGATEPAGPANFLWPAQSGTSGELYSFFTAGSSNLDVALRIMSDSLEAVSSPVAAGQAILAPNLSASPSNPFPPDPAPGNQSAPSATLLNGLYYYAFQDDSANGDPDIHVHAFDSSLADVGGIVAINAEANQQVSPSMAASNGVLLVAWQDVNGPHAGEIVARTYDPSADAGSALGTENVLSTGTSNENVKVAATPTGWIAVWDDTTQVKMRVISSTGTPSGTEIQVSTGSNHNGVQDHPGVATLNDGRTAIVWADHGNAQADVYVQRYDATLTAVAGDQATPVNDLVTSGDQLQPTVASTSSAFVAAWVDSPTGDVRAAILGGPSGYLFNPVTGQPTEFKASIAANVNRLNPVVAVGGSGPWIALGWNDSANIYARRFPTNTEQ